MVVRKLFTAKSFLVLLPKSLHVNNVLAIKSLNQFFIYSEKHISFKEDLKKI
jgi:hypothetical protein